MTCSRKFYVTSFHPRLRPRGTRFVFSIYYFIINFIYLNLPQQLHYLLLKTVPIPDYYKISVIKINQIVVGRPLEIGRWRRCEMKDCCTSCSRTASSFVGITAFAEGGEGLTSSQVRAPPHPMASSRGARPSLNLLGARGVPKRGTSPPHAPPCPPGSPHSGNTVNVSSRRVRNTNIPK